MGQHVVTAILGGGQGARLWPLTRDRAKPAVPVGGKFRLIDIPISNSLHAHLERIYVLTQFNSASLHRHIAQTYRFDTFSKGFVNILAAQQSVQNQSWYQGTADAVRQNIDRLAHSGPSEILVLSGDQLYLMSMAHFLQRHRQAKADVTIAVKPVSRERAGELGIMRVDEAGRIVEFVEKPKDPAVLDALTPSSDALGRMGLQAPPGYLLASMGIYVFRTQVLEELLQGDEVDFGREIIPQAIGDHPVYAFPYDGYWEDIGTIPSFHHASLDLTLPVPPMNLYDPLKPIYTHPRFLPGTKVDRCEIEQSILCEGSIVSGARVNRSIIGIRAVLRRGTTVDNSVVMGAGVYENEGDGEGPIALGIGEGCEIRNAIIDLNARIGDNCRIVNDKGVEDADAENYAIRGGVVVIPKGAVLEPGTII
jgi:glucose-1-phosphate adenylyltransferase